MFGLFKKKSKSIIYKGKEYSIKELRDLDSKYEEEWYKNNPLDEALDKYSIESLELSDDQLKNLEDYKLNKKATAWKSRQRKLRREGKLEQERIDKLNELGMVWNPREDEWEVNFQSFKNYGLIDPLEEWIKEQRKLYKNNKLNSENLIRLKSIKFPFESKENETFRLTNSQVTEMLECISFGIKEYQGDGSFWKRNDNSPKIKKEIENQQTWASKRKDTRIKELKSLTDEDFIKEIDEILNREYYAERINRGFIQSKHDHYATMYYDLFKYINGNFETNKADIVKFHCSEDVKIYAAESALYLLDDKLLKSGKMNDAKSFPPVAKLISHFSKNKMPQDLEAVNLTVQKYPILRAIYGERIQKLLIKLK